MTARLDNLQMVFDRTDWVEFAVQKAALTTAVEGAYLPSQRVNELHGLLNWLNAIETAARMDGYQTGKESTQ